MAKLAIISDIHGNLFALDNVLHDIAKRNIDGYIILGDLIDYGMQPNEAVSRIMELDKDRILVNLWGNHEKAILTDEYRLFSTERGRNSAKYTKSVLSNDVLSFLNMELTKEGIKRLKINELNCLAVHGSVDEYFWKAITPDNLHGDYTEFDIVFSGHSHYPHYFQKFYDVDNPEMRNKKRVIFINPGSVGQPRNHNPNAQYAIFDSETLGVELKSTPYDIKAAMELYQGEIDFFYRDRLAKGI